MAKLAPQYSDKGDFNKALDTYNKISDIINNEIQRAQSNDESDLLVQNDLSRIKMEKALVLVKLNRCKDVEPILNSPNLQRADQKLYQYLKEVVKRSC